MLYCYARLSLIITLSWTITIVCSAQSIHVDSIITLSSLKEMVQTLSADSFQGRLTGTVHASRAALYISSAFEKAGAMPIAGNDGYIMPFTMGNKVTAFNVVAALPGRSRAGELIIFSAHYDHIGTKNHTVPYYVPERGKPEKKDKIYNGANDNASGISGLIHLARYFARYPQRERTIIFIAFSGEEEGLLGSKHLAEAFDPKAVTAMVNMDMIGRPVSENNKNPYITGEEHSNLQELLNKRLFHLAPQYGEKYFRPDRFTHENLYARSDNFPFAKRGVIAHTIITSSPVDIYYHSLNDEWETLDYPFMTEVVKAIALATTGLADGSDTPKK
ncbi:M20/M25/M40 family metallo-hydrolase [Longitalea luteola]|uniref:M20/M25/M40 family metallo-hydrolase n=1 Tax=Longitalea luteola TaxID=2812563 RepID=UPI001A971339|nr:M20/M25/M40 family metallo-hydrolase [Longitalea luteola]